MKLYTGGKKSTKSQRRALLRLKRRLGNLNNSEVSLVEAKEPGDAVKKEKKSYVLVCGGTIRSSQKVEATQLPTHG